MEQDCDPIHTVSMYDIEELIKNIVFIKRKKLKWIQETKNSKKVTRILDREQ